MPVDCALLVRTGHVHEHPWAFGLPDDRRAIGQSGHAFHRHLLRLKSLAWLRRENQHAAAVAILRRLLDHLSGDDKAAFHSQTFGGVRHTQLDFILEALPLHGDGNRHRAFCRHVDERHVQNHAKVLRHRLYIQTVAVGGAAAAREILDRYRYLLHPIRRLDPQDWLAGGPALVPVVQILGQRFVARSAQDVSLLVADRDHRHELRRPQLSRLDAECHPAVGRYAERVSIHLGGLGQPSINRHRHGH